MKKSEEEIIHNDTRTEQELIARGNRRSEAYNQAVKGLIILNGGAILALITLLTQIVMEESYEGLITPIMLAMVCFVGGIIFAIPVNPIRYECSRLYDDPKKTPKGSFMPRIIDYWFEGEHWGVKYGKVFRLMFIISWLCFLLGAVIIIYGLFQII